MKKKLLLFWISIWLVLPVLAQQAYTVGGVEYIYEYNIPYCNIKGTLLTMNAFLPSETTAPTAVMIEIHGGWWSRGQPAKEIPEILAKKGIAVFSISYRLGKNGGFPENIRDCRNAVRFIRKNAIRFNIDPNRIGCLGGSAGGHLSLMLAMLPEDFDDGGATEGLSGISAKVNSCFSFVAPTDLIRSWNQSPTDEIINHEGGISYREASSDIPNDSRPHLRMLFHGVVPDNDQGKALYRKMSPVSHVRKDLPPILICDGDIDPIVPGLHGKILHEKLLGVGADSSYWMTINGGHAFPSGDGFAKVLDDFLDRTLILKDPK